jgi:hypothetical protein
MYILFFFFKCFCEHVTCIFIEFLEIFLIGLSGHTVWKIV